MSKDLLALRSAGDWDALLDAYNRVIHEPSSPDEVVLDAYLRKAAILGAHADEALGRMHLASAEAYGAEEARRAALAASDALRGIGAVAEADYLQAWAADRSPRVSSGGEALLDDARVRAGFYAAATYNIAGILVFSKGFTNTVMHETDPVLFSVPGCILIVIWGLAYLAQSRSWRAGPAVSAVFAVEKVFYATWWVWWLALNGSRLGEIAAADPLAGAFYAVYGAGDAAFAVFFAWAALRASRG